MTRLKIIPRLLGQAILAGNWKFHLAAFGLPALVFLLDWWYKSPSAALRFLIGYLVMAGLVLTWWGWKLDFAREIRLEPQPGRAKINRQAGEKLAGELVGLGFLPAGFFKAISGKRALFIEGWANPDLKMYATIFCGHAAMAPFVELTSRYADGGSRCLNSGRLNAWPRPENMSTQSYPGRSPAELVALMKENRPTEGLLETPPEGFQQSIEDELRRVREFNLSRRSQPGHPHRNGL